TPWSASATFTSNSCAPVLRDLCFFARREDFSCSLGELIELIDAAPGGRQNSYENGTSGFDDVITMGARCLLDQSMGPQQTELSADGRGAAPTIRQRLGCGGVQQFLQVAMAETVEQEIAMIDRGEKFLV